jgi:hypothetical protein
MISYTPEMARMHVQELLRRGQAARLPSQLPHPAGQWLVRQWHGMVRAAYVRSRRSPQLDTTPVYQATDR